MVLNYKKYPKNIVTNKLLNNNIIKNNKNKNFFKESFNYISNFQKKLIKSNIENYISGGYAFNLYVDKNNLLNNNKNILLTSDVDIILLYDIIKKNGINNRINNRINNTINYTINYTIINNIKYIIDAIIDPIKNNKNGILKLYQIINYETENDFDILIKSISKEGFDLILYKLNPEKNSFMFNFIKKINNIFIKIEIKFVKIDMLIKKNIYSYGTLNYYSYKRLNNKLKIYQEYLPIELIILDKKEINTNLIKNSIEIENNIFYLYNIKFLIYNLVNIHFRYKYNTKNKGLLLKKNKGHFLRDEKRLFYILKLYCLKQYNISDNNIVKYIFKQFKLYNSKFKIYMFKINNLDIIDNIIKKSLNNL